MRAPALLLALAGCVNAGDRIDWPKETDDLAFLVWTERGLLTRVSAPFLLEDGVPQGLDAPIVAFEDRETVLLVGLSRAVLSQTTVLLDESRLLQSRLLLQSDPICEQRFDAARTTASQPLPSAARVASVWPKGASAPSVDFLRASLRLELPLGERPCEPPVRVQHFALGGEALSDGVIVQGSPRMRRDRDAETRFQIHDAQYLSADEALILVDHGIAVLPRGGRLISDQDPGFLRFNDPRLPWPRETGGASFALLPAFSTPQRQRLLLIGQQGGGDPGVPHPPPETWAVTLEREGNDFTVLGSTVALGARIRAVVDLEGRAWFGGRPEDDERGDSVLLWTEDGLSFGRRTVPYSVEDVVATDDERRPHLLHNSRIPEIRVGDLTDASRVSLEQIGLDPKFRVGVHSASARVFEGALRVAVGGENQNMRYADLHTAPWSADQWIDPRPSPDASTVAAGCTTLPDGCFHVGITSEIAEITILRTERGRPEWFLMLPKKCHHLMAVREDGCTTHVPLEPVVYIESDRSMLSIRTSPDGRRALVAGRGGRLFELEFDH